MTYSYFIFKQKTAYEMRISDWSSDVCSSDLIATGTLIQKIPCHENPSTTAPPTTGPIAIPRPETPPHTPIAMARLASGTAATRRVSESGMIAEIGRESCRVRVCQYV